MSPRRTDENLLFGVLALQMGFIDRDELIAATIEWIRDKSQPLAAVFVRRGRMSEDRRRKIEDVVQEHVAMHGHDVAKSLGSLNSMADVRDQLEHLDDREIAASLPPAMKRAGKADPNQTLQPLPVEKPNGSRFQKIRFHDRGGLGMVYVALDSELNREVALKEIRPEYADIPDSRNRFHVEAEVTGGLEHPGVVPVYSLGKGWDGRPYYAMRFIRGERLDKAIAEHHAAQNGSRSESDSAMSLPQLLRRFTDVCYVLQYAHDRGVVHRDIKPANIMLGAHNETLVVDWGLAKVLGESGASAGDLPPLKISGSSHASETQHGAAVGTVAYMSPEQASGAHDTLGPSSDIFNLGATLYHLLVNRPPRVTDDSSDANELVRRTKILPPRRVNPRTPPALSAICMKAMARSPDERYPTAKALAEDVERWLEDNPVSAYREPVVERAARWMRRNRNWTISGVTSLAVIAVVAVVAAVLTNAARRETEYYYQEALAAVDNSFTRLSEEELLNEPGLQPLRRDLLQYAGKYYAAWLARRGADASLAEETARNHFRIGRVRELLGETDQALESYRAARRMQESLLQASPENLVALRDLSKTVIAMGQAYRNAGMHNEALTSFREATELRKRLVERGKSDPENDRLLANGFMNQAAILEGLGKFEEAISLYDGADAIRKLAMQTSKDDRLADDLARGYFNRAKLLVRCGSVQEAKRPIDEALERFAAAAPSNPEQQFLKGLCLLLKGEILLTSAQWDHAIDSYADARDTFDTLAHRNPAVLKYQHQLGDAHLNLGLAYFTRAVESRRSKRETDWTEDARAAKEELDESLRWLEPLAERRQPDLACRENYVKAVCARAYLDQFLDERDRAKARVRDLVETVDAWVQADPTNAEFYAKLHTTCQEELAGIERTQSSSGSGDP